MKAVLEALLAYFRTPTSIVGITALVTGLVGGLSGSITWAAAGTVISGAVVAILIPDNSVSKTELKKLMTESVVSGQVVIAAKKNAVT